MRVAVSSRVRRPGITAGALRRIARAALRAERRPPQTAVSIVLAGDGTIRRLNRQFLGRDRPTDVLAFPLDDDPPVRERGRGASKHRHRLLGEIVISIDRARRQAKAAGHPLRSEVALLAVHGLLHLNGYDDRSPAAARRMHRREREILEALGEDVRG